MRTEKRGFTLVELLIVISILALLAGMVVPVLTGVLIQAKIAGTKGQMGSLSVAIRLYRDTFHTFPPSNPSIVAACGGGQVGVSHAATGAESMTFFLRGWYISSGTVRRGQGFRISALGGLTKTIQPMYPPEKDEEVRARDSRYGFGGAANGTFFSDKFDGNRPILYFKAATDGGSQPYTESHNGLPLAKWKAPSPKSFSSVIKPDGITPRSVEFILWSSGPDELFMNKDDLIYP